MMTTTCFDVVEGWSKGTDPNYQIMYRMASQVSLQRNLEESCPIRSGQVARLSHPRARCAESVSDGTRGTAPLGMAIRVWVPGTRRVPNLMGTGMGMIFYPWVAPVPDLN
jgi:hypothetical protein